LNVLTVLVAIVNAAPVEPAATVTLDGTLATELLLLDRLTGTFAPESRTWLGSTSGLMGIFGW